MIRRASIRFFLHLIVAFAAVFGWKWAHAQDPGLLPPASPFNGRQLEQPDSSAGFHFLVGGHLYGSHYNSESVFPASSFLANIRRINSTGASALFTCGDLVRDGGDPIQQKALRKAFQGLEIPVYNAPGNHDLKGDGSFEKVFGPLQTAFLFQENLFILLNSEAWVGGQPDSLIQFLRKQQAELDSSKATFSNVFVFSHRLLWSCLEKRLEGADEVTNEPILQRAKVESGKEIVQAVRKISGVRPIHWFSGDVGASWSVPLLYMKGPERMHFYATGIGDAADDALLSVMVDSSSHVKVRLFPLADTVQKPLETHTLEWARRRMENNNRLEVPVFPMARRFAVWAALAGGLICGFMLGWIWFKFRSRSF